MARSNVAGVGFGRLCPFSPNVGLGRLFLYKIRQYTSSDGSASESSALLRTRRAIPVSAFVCSLLFEIHFVDLLNTVVVGDFAVWGKKLR